jgi:hypothetical protein
MTAAPLPPELQAIFEALVAAHPDGLTLDELSEELLRKPVGYAEIDLLIGALEQAGFDLEGKDTPTRPEQLIQVLTAARELTEELGQRPSAEQIAERTGLTAVAVRRALRFGRTIGT